MRKCLRAGCLSTLLVLTASLGGCTGNVGVGVSVGVPIGSHGYMSVGTSRWF
jgi:hypothetical protein